MGMLRGVRAHGWSRSCGPMPVAGGCSAAFLPQRLAVAFAFLLPFSPRSGAGAALPGSCFPRPRAGAWTCPGILVSHLLARAEHFFLSYPNEDEPSKSQLPGEFSLHEASGIWPWKTTAAARRWLQPLRPHCQLLGTVYPRLHWKEAFLCSQPLLGTVHGALSPSVLCSPSSCQGTPPKNPLLSVPPPGVCCFPASSRAGVKRAGLEAGAGKSLPHAQSWEVAGLGRALSTALPSACLNLHK